MKKAGLMFIICFGLLILSTIVSVSYTPRSERKARTFMKVILATNLLSYSSGLVGGLLLIKESKK